MKELEKHPTVCTCMGCDKNKTTFSSSGKYSHCDPDGKWHYFDCPCFESKEKEDATEGLLKWWEQTAQQLEKVFPKSKELQGWKCPVCFGGNSPYTDRCPCTPFVITTDSVKVNIE